LGTSQPEPREPKLGGADAVDTPGVHGSITGVPRWALIVIPFALVVLVVGVGFIIGAVTSVDGGPGFATPTPRAPASAQPAP